MKTTAQIISEQLNEQKKFLIRTAPDSIANRSQMDWRPMPEDILEDFKDFLEKPEQKAVLERGEFITINRYCGMLTEHVKYA